MKINWRLRLKNKAWLAALAATVTAFAFNVMELLGITPLIGEETVINAISALMTLLAALGVIMDPTTPGVKDASDVLETGNG